jgi:hypothetical protein
MIADVFWDYLITGVFGLLIGSTELMSRYRDAPLESIKTWFAAFYIGLNIIASMMALWLLRLFGVTFGLEDDPLRLRWVQVLTAGLGAMMLFRSSLFIFRAGDRDVSVGPSSILEVLLDVLDRQVDRERAKKRARVVEEVMAEISFPQASVELPIIAFALLQNLSREDQESTHNKILKLSSSNVSNAAKSNALGLALIDAVGEEVLRASVKIYKRDIQIEQTPSPNQLSLTPGLVDRALRAKGLISESGSDGDNIAPAEEEPSEPVPEPDDEPPVEPGPQTVDEPTG